MSDMMFGYRWWGKPKPLTWQEIEQMKKIMKKVPIIQQRNEEYHQKESEKADDEFEKKINNL